MAGEDDGHTPIYGGMGNLDASQAERYAQNMRGKQSEKEIGKDIKGVRSEQPMFRSKSYGDIDKENTERYSNLEKTKKLINKIPR